MYKDESELLQLEEAIRLFFQTIKRPHYWSDVLNKSKVKIDRPAAVILQTLASLKTNSYGVQELAHMLGIEAPSITRKTQELESEGLIYRVQSSEDRRAIKLQISEEGLKVARKVKIAQREIISQTLKDWDTNKRNEFISLFNQFSIDFSKVVNTAGPIKGEN